MRACSRGLNVPHTMKAYRIAAGTLTPEKTPAELAGAVEGT